MSEANKSYRIRTEIGKELTTDYITLDASLTQDYDTFEVLSVSIDSVDTYKLHNSNYGVVVGRVLANNGFGIPNAKISIFISADSDDGDALQKIYPYTSTVSKNDDGVRYNLLPDEQVSDCHQVVGTFPNKRYLLDNDVILEIFDKYYVYTTRTNNAGDYIIMGVPTGAQTLHMDLDLSDCGILSQRPRDFVYKGYTIEQFENPNMFKTASDIDSLSQIVKQDQVVYVNPFWGNSSLGETIGITRADINVAFKFEPTCVFLGCIASDNSSQGISKKCIPTENMGNMEEMTTGEGTIEMIRKTASDTVEEFQVKGTQLINENGIWCYQIPMNLDYMMTDEYGNMVPTDDPEKGIPTRARVRFRIGMQDNEENVDNFFRPKVLVPHNPQNLVNGMHEPYDYEFGTLTNEESYRDLFWNNVYSVKSYIPRFQKRKVRGWKEKKFSGIKSCNFFGQNNPIPYNNIRIRLPLMFTIICAILKCLIFVTGIINLIISSLGNMMADIGDTKIPAGITINNWKIQIKWWYPFTEIYKKATQLKMNVLKDGLCPDLENWYFAPMYIDNLWSPSKKVPDGCKKYDLLGQTLEQIIASGDEDDPQSIDDQNQSDDESTICLTVKTDYLLACLEMNIAMEYRVINFDFYNDWINGLIYIPRFMRYVRPKKKFLGVTIARAKVKGCMDNTKTFSKSRKYTQQCAIGYRPTNIGKKTIYTNVKNPISNGKPLNITRANNFHKKNGFKQRKIFGKNGGICHEQTTMLGQYVYYLKPCEWTTNTSPNALKINLFATDIILLGSLNDCDLNGVPMAFKHLNGSSYIMPTNLALTNMETDGPLYATGRGTICLGNAGTDSNDIMYGDSGVTVMPISGDALTTELNYYARSSGETVDTTYEGNEESDTIAMTEAAGISWNWSGPGQGDISKERMYYPGGHFLGLSCANSQTNIKSCINLERICEVGVSMSQRKEDVSKLKSDGTFEYTYTAPSGFISGDDILDSDFRTMFATMNQERLLATRINPETGYKVYDFSYVRPNNFDGAFSELVEYSINGEKYYNRRIPVNEEGSKLKRFGIGLGENRDDFDEAETGNTQIKTIESASIDYYMFRYGLNYEHLKRGDELQMRRFLYTDGASQYLPQYENSFYFYFGMKQGATAIDEFNKQFFAECDTTNLISKEIVTHVDVDANMCEGKGNVTVLVDNVENPYSYISLSGIVAAYIIDGTHEGDEEKLYQSEIVFYDVPLGDYTLTIVDGNGTEIVKTVQVGTDKIGLVSTVYDFNYNTEVYGTKDASEERGGYIKIESLTIYGLENQTVVTGRVENSKKEIVINTDSPTPTNFYVDKAYNGDEIITYTFYVDYSCNGSTTIVSIPLRTFTVDDNRKIDLIIGNQNVYSLDYLTNFRMTGMSKTEWWLTNPCSITADTKENWLYKVCFFKENSSAETFSNNVTAVNGTKVVWGSPQKIRDIKKDGITYSSETVADWPDGYSVDDDASYMPTYGVDYYNDVVQYSALAYNGVKVCGNYYGSVNSNGTVKILDKSRFHNGAGMIYKPIPEGDLEFLVYHGEGDYPEISGNTDNDGTVNKTGILYPSFVYPVINRPFCADAKFFVWDYRVFEDVTDENGNTSTVCVDREFNGIAELSVKNGITYNKKFETDSFEMSCYSPYSSYTMGDAINQFNTDTSGLTDINSEPRVLLYSGHSYCSASTDGSYISDTDGCSGLSSFRFTLKEGHPDNNSSDESYTALVNEITAGINGVIFPEYMTYFVTTAKTPTICLQGQGSDISNGIKYALCDTNRVDFIKDVGYLYETRKKNIFKSEFAAMFTYTSAATYDNEGTPVYVYINDPTGGKTIYEYQLTDENGNKYTKRSKVRVNAGQNENMSIEAVDADDIAIEAMHRKVISTSPKEGGKIISYESAVTKSMISEWKEADSDIIASVEIPYNSDYEKKKRYFAVAKYEYNDNNYNPGGSITIYKIYPYIFKSVYNGEWQPPTDIAASVSELIFEAPPTPKYQDVEITGDSKNLCSIAVEYDGNQSDWLILRNNGNVITGFTSDYTIISVYPTENTSTETRTAKIKMGTLGSTDDCIIDVIQYGKKDTLFTATPNPLEFKSDGGSLSLTIETDSTNQWAASLISNGNWLSLSKTNGVGSMSIDVIAKASEESRSATILFSYGSGVYTVNVLQTAANSFDVNPKTITLDTANDTETNATITIDGSNLWVSRSNADWLSVSPTTQYGNYDVTITALANNSRKARTGVIEFWPDYDASNIKTITVTQPGVVTTEITVTGFSRTLESSVQAGGGSDSQEDIVVISDNISIEGIPYEIKITTPIKVNGSLKAGDDDSAFILAEIDNNGTAIINGYIDAEQETAPYDYEIINADSYDWSSTTASLSAYLKVATESKRGGSASVSATIEMESGTWVIKSLVYN